MSLTIYVCFKNTQSQNAAYETASACFLTFARQYLFCLFSHVVWICGILENTWGDFKGLPTIKRYIEIQLKVVPATEEQIFICNHILLPWDPNDVSVLMSNMFRNTHLFKMYYLFCKSNVATNHSIPLLSSRQWDAKFLN